MPVQETDRRSVTEKVLAILAVFTPSCPELTLSEIARRANLTLPTAHRRANELVVWGALERGDDNKYRIGLRLWEVASLAPRRQQLRKAAMPALEDLHLATSENVYLAVREGQDLLMVERITGPLAVPTVARAGRRFPFLHATGVGQVLLAHAPVAVQEEILSAPLGAYTPMTITEPNQLRAVLAAVRRNGCAVAEGQVTANALSVAAPIRDAKDQVVAAVSVVTHLGSIAPSQLSVLVRSAARDITRALGACA